jgi:hypothetical protein
MEHRDDPEVSAEAVTEEREQTAGAPTEREAAAPARSPAPAATATVEPVESSSGEPTEPPGDARPETAEPPIEDVEPVIEDRVAVVVAESRERYGGRWKDLQTGFVDEPREAVQQADQLVAEVIDTLTQSFLAERRRLEEQWSGNDVDTEQLRVALQRYRMLFRGLLED